jgi:hypothetical protein
MHEVAREMHVQCNKAIYTAGRAEQGRQGIPLLSFLYVKSLLFM